MAEKRGKRRFLTIIGILVIIVLIVVGAKIFGSKAPIKPMILNAIELRQTTEPLKKANMISELDDLVSQADNAHVTEQWEALVECLATGCHDGLYSEFILAIALEYQDKLPHSALIINIISTNRYWGSESVIEFSRAMTLVDEDIQKLDSRKIEKKWDEIVECNGVCAEKNDLVFDLVGLIMQA